MKKLFYRTVGRFICWVLQRHVIYVLVDSLSMPYPGLCRICGRIFYETAKGHYQYVRRQLWRQEKGLSCEPFYFDAPALDGSRIVYIEKRREEKTGY
jgi:hypothetical protein